MHNHPVPTGRIAYVNGRYLPHGSAMVHIEDRGLQFADAVYEVCMIAGGLLMDEKDHLDRLGRSLDELAMPMPMARSALRLVMRETARRNRIADGILYLQVTRGAYRRDHVMPKDAKSTLIITLRPFDLGALDARRSKGVSVISLPDIRWGRCDIKTTGLLPNAMAKTEAKRKGAYEAWFTDAKGFVTEGSSTNAWIVAGGVVVTRSLDNILPGVTRKGVLGVIADEKLRLEERPFSLKEAWGAEEAFITSASAGVMPVVSIDGHAIGKGMPGPIAARLQAAYSAHSLKEAVG